VVSLNDTQEESATISVVEKASPSVVSIVISKDVSSINNDSFFDPFGLFGEQRGSSGSGGTGDQQKDQGQNNQKQQVGGGSGFIVSPDGLIITNKHVVSDQSSSYSVILNNGKQYEAKIVAVDPVNDLAFIKIDASGLPLLKFADSNNLKIGQTVIAIGYSLGEFENSVSKGIISGLKRQVIAGSGVGESERLSEVIQTDAAINPGNSGGPLLNLQGEVIGVNVAMAQGAENVGFALPGDLAKKDIESVQRKGKISQPYLGVRYLIVNKQIQQQNNLPNDYGALVARGQSAADLAVVPGSPADKAGIIENDIILEIDGKKVDESNTPGDILSKYNVGDKVTLKIWHKGEEKTVDAVLGERS
jgi:serine protease Do